MALIGAARSETLGFQDRVRAVRLSSESAQRHPRYAHFEAQDWRRVERILDRGEWIEQPDGRRLLWIAEDRKPSSTSRSWAATGRSGRRTPTGTIPSRPVTPSTKRVLPRVTCAVSQLGSHLPRSPKPNSVVSLDR